MRLTRGVSIFTANGNGDSNSDSHVAFGGWSEGEAGLAAPAWSPPPRPHTAEVIIALEAPHASKYDDKAWPGKPSGYDVVSR